MTALRNIHPTSEHWTTNHENNGDFTYLAELTDLIGAGQVEDNKVVTLPTGERVDMNMFDPQYVCNELVGWQLRIRDTYAETSGKHINFIIGND